jgi:phospholipase C
VTAGEAAAGNDGRLGCRVPCALIGPRARRSYISQLQFDHNSVLNMIAWRFGFTPLGARASSINIAHALDFSGTPDTSSPAFDVPAGPFGQQCMSPEIADELGLPVLPGVPVVCLPLANGIALPPVPGLDVPLPLPLETAARPPDGADAARRFRDHHGELDRIRQLSRRHGFA